MTVCIGKQTYFARGCAIQQKVSCPLQLRSLDNFVLYRLSKGTLLYRAGQLYSDRPVWYGPEKTAKRYARGNPVEKYKTKKELVLMYMSYNNIRALYDVISSKLSDNDKKVFDAVVFTFSHKDIKKYNQIKKKSPTVHTLMNFRGFLDDDLNNYKSLRLAKILCRFGIDGWIVENDTILQKHKLFTNRPVRHEEILICDPLSVLEQSK
jgi:hypothetical protein